MRADRLRRGRERSFDFLPGRTRIARHRFERINRALQQLMDQLTIRACVPA